MMLRKLFLLSALTSLACCWIACNNPAQEENQIPADSSQQTSVPQDTLTGKQSDLQFLSKFSGQYPSDIQLFEKVKLNNRIKFLLGDKYADFRKFWQTETPILMEDNVLFTTGCEQHNCAANQYILQIDLNNDNINIYHIGSKLSTYTEKGTIHLPPGLAKEFLIIKGNTTASI